MVMTDLTFALHLGSGVYLDSDGNIHQGPAPDTVIYEAEFKLPIDPKKAADAFKSVKDAFEDVDDPQKNQKILKTLNDIYGFLFADGKGVDATNILKMFATISKIAGTVAPILAAVGFAFDVAKMFGLFKEGPSALELLMNKRFDELKRYISAIATLIINENLEEGRIAVMTLNASVKEYVTQLKNSNPTLAQLEADLISIKAAHESHVEGTFKLIRKATYQTIFDSSAHSQVWALMQHHLFTHPGGPGSASPALMEPDGKPTFDHRLMVPLATFAGESYLATARGVAPEYRSTGEFREHLRDFAKAIQELADSMRGQVLARTIYTAADFNVLLDVNDVIRIDSHAPFVPDLLIMSPKCNRFPVGALDLRYHDNAFFSAFFAQLFKAEAYGWERTTKKGGMDFRWLPPATLEFVKKTPTDPLQGDQYRITNPDQCAAAANAQSELDYADLLAVSGYTQLLQLAVLYRNEATDPNRSQTVQIKTPDLQRKLQPSVSVTIESEPVPLTGKITASARREPQAIVASVNVWTQPIKRTRPIEYTVQLRTLRSILGANRWHEPLYSAFQFVHYEPEAADRRFMEMLIDQRDGARLDDEFLIKGTSPRDGARRTEGTAILKAHSFDWWIPVIPPFSINVPFEKTVHMLRGLGHDTITPDTSQPRPAADIHRMFDPGARFAKVSDTIFEHSFPKLAWLDGAQDWEGEHRDPKETTVTIKWHLVWDGDRMNITLEADPADRNYVVYVVVEEQLRGPGAKILHTAMPVPINGQLTYIPQPFFDAEQEAIKKAAKIAAEFNRKYSLSTKVGPSDPVVGWLRPGDLVTTAGLTKVLALAEQHQPEILREILGGG